MAQWILSFFPHCTSWPVIAAKAQVFTNNTIHESALFQWAMTGWQWASMHKSGPWNWNIIVLLTRVLLLLFWHVKISSNLLFSHLKGAILHLWMDEDKLWTHSFKNSCFELVCACAYVCLCVCVYVCVCVCKYVLMGPLIKTLGLSAICQR